jgi:RNA polymerase sporulation-specific sigma factor
MTINAWNKKTDEELVLLFRSGGEGAMEELFRRHSGLVRSCARRYFLIGGETEDLIQEGMIGLYRAMGSYDGNREGSSSFKNFAYLCISRQILDAVKRASKSGAEAYSLNGGMAERGLDPEELLILSDEQKEFRQKMSRELSDFEFKVMTMYMDGMTCAEICETTGKSAKSVDNALQRSKRKLLGMILKK